MNGDIIISLCLLAVTILMIYLAHFSWQLSRKYFDIPILVDCIFFFVFFKIIFYYLLPTLMRIVSNYQFEREVGVTTIDLLKVYVIELISWSSWMYSLLFVFKNVGKGKIKKSIQDLHFSNINLSKNIAAFLCIGFIIFRLLDVATNGLAVGYLEVFSSLFVSAGLTISPFLIVLSFKFYDKKYFLIGIFSSLISFGTISSRGNIFYYLMFCIFLTWSILKSPKVKIAFASTFVALSIIYMIIGGVPTISLNYDINGSYVFSFDVDTEKKEGRTTINEIEHRFGASTRTGTAFINLYDEGKSAGFAPIQNSLLGFLPRSMNASKPHPSTVDGDDIYSQGMYVISRKIYGENTFSMVEFPTGGHFYWEFGFVGVIVLSAISGLYIGLCAHFFSKLGLVSIPLLVVTFKPWGYVDPKIWVSDIALQIYQIILPLLLVVYIVKYIARFNFFKYKDII